MEVIIMTELTYTAYQPGILTPVSEHMDTIFQFRLKDPGSAITHFIGFAAAILGTPILLVRASAKGTDLMELIGFSIFLISMILLYGASTAYHSFNISPKANKILKKIDHMMIFILIAGTYTPICLTVIGGKTGLLLLSLVYGIAAVGIIIKACWIFCPKWFSSILYIGMGWVCLLAFPQILASCSHAAFLWLLGGGILYTIGGVLYALKLKAFNSIHKHFGSHEIFHLFVLGGSFCHFMTMMCL